MTNKTITDLEKQFECALERKLIVSYEHILYRDYIVVQLHESSSDDMKQKLKVHIRETYRQVNYVTTGAKPNQNYLYIKYAV
jgi:hypothetical protein